jgi:hypothetical protein
MLDLCNGSKCVGMKITEVINVEIKCPLFQPGFYKCINTAVFSEHKIMY